ncbi:MAG: hypothetical protein ACYTG0_38420 [Planctomycetota bacterium]
MQLAGNRLAVIGFWMVWLTGRWPLAAEPERGLDFDVELTVAKQELSPELGVLITGGKLPAQVEENFGALIGTGVLVRAR